MHVCAVPTSWLSPRATFTIRDLDAKESLDIKVSSRQIAGHREGILLHLFLMSRWVTLVIAPLWTTHTSFLRSVFVRAYLIIRWMFTLFSRG